MVSGYNITEEKKKLIEKQDYETVHSRFEAEKDIILPEVNLTVTAGGLQESATGTVFEPPFICEWIIEPLRHLFCTVEGEPDTTVKLEKAIYGRTRYNWSFYDPAYDILKVIKTLQHALVRPEISKNIGRILVGSGVSDIAGIEMVFQHRSIKAIVRALHASGIRAVRDQRDIYRGLETEVWEDKVLYKVDVEGVGEVLFDTLSNLLIGVIVGITPLGYGFLLPQGLEVFSTYFFNWLALRAGASTDKFLPAYSASKASKKTVIAYGLEYTKEGERFGESRSYYYHVKRVIDNLLDGFNLDPVTRQAYVSAGVELAFSGAPPKGVERVYVRKYKHDLDWGELVRHWVAKWEALGLKEEILIYISERVKPVWESLKRKR